MKKKSAKKKIKKSSGKRKSKLSVLPTKVSDKDRNVLARKAKRYAKGNVSAWIRHAGLKYVPKKGEVINANGYK